MVPGAPNGAPGFALQQLSTWADVRGAQPTRTATGLYGLDDFLPNLGADIVHDGNDNGDCPDGCASLTVHEQPDPLL